MTDCVKTRDRPPKTGAVGGLGSCPCMRLIYYGWRLWLSARTPFRVRKRLVAENISIVRVDRISHGSICSISISDIRLNLYPSSYVVHTCANYFKEDLLYLQPP